MPLEDPEILDGHADWLHVISVSPAPPTPRRVLAMALVSIAVIAAQLLTALPAGAQDDATGSVQSVVSCVATAEDVRVLFLIDESGSLKFTDPDNERITAAKFALETFLDLTVEKQVEVRLAGFSDDFRDETAEWVVLEAATAGRLADEIDSFATRSNGIDTDLPNALAGAFDTLSPLEESTCNLLLLFADGGYDIQVRNSAEQQELYGIEKPYAPGIELTDPDAIREARVLGREALCDADDSTMASIDEGGVRLVTIALADSAFIDLGLLESLTTGRADGQVCGADLTGSRGVFSPVGSDDLALAFGEIAGRVVGGSVAASSIAVCTEGEDCVSARSVQVDQLISRFTVDAVFAEPGQQLLIIDPEGERARISFDRPRDVALPGAVASANWLADDSVSVEVLPSSGSELLAGEWQISAVAPSSDSDPANILVSRFPNLLAEIPNLEAFQPGAPNLIEATVTTLNGEPIDDLSLAVEATVTDQTGEAFPLTLDRASGTAGTFDAVLDLPKDFVGPAIVSVDVLATTDDGLEFTTTAETLVVVRLAPPAAVENSSTPLSTQLLRLAAVGLVFAVLAAAWTLWWRRREASKALFELEGLTIAKVPVVIRGDGALFRIDEEARPLALAPSDFHKHPEPVATKVLKLPEVTLEVVPAGHPFAERSATATAASPLTSTAGNKALNQAFVEPELGGTWVFLLDQENSLAANDDAANPAYGSIAGQLVVFLRQGHTDVSDFFRRLPTEVVPHSRTLFRDVRAERLAATPVEDSNMLEWVDQWAGNDS